MWHKNPGGYKMLRKQSQRSHIFGPQPFPLSQTHIIPLKFSNFQGLPIWPLWQDEPRPSTSSISVGLLLLRPHSQQSVHLTACWDPAGLMLTMTPPHTLDCLPFNHWHRSPIPPELSSLGSPICNAFPLSHSSSLLFTLPWPPFIL